MFRSRIASRSAIAWALSSASFKSISSSAGPPQSLLISAQRLMSNTARSHADTVAASAVVSPILDATPIQQEIFNEATTLQGSKALQLKLENANIDERQLIVNKLLDHVAPLTNDMFGSYVIQQVLKVGSAEQKALVMSRLIGNVLQSSLNKYGNHVIQKALAAADDITRGKLISELEGSVVECARNVNGSHVIRKSLDVADDITRGKLMSELEGSVLKCATDVNGSHVIQKALNVADDITRGKLISELEGSVLECTRNVNGSHVIKKVLDVADDITRAKLISELEGSVLKCVSDVHGSHVIQKALDVADDITRGKLMSELEGSVLKCTRNVNGSHVIQKALAAADDITRGKLISDPEPPTLNRHSEVSTAVNRSGPIHSTERSHGPPPQESLLSSNVPLPGIASVVSHVLNSDYVNASILKYYHCRDADSPHFLTIPNVWVSENRQMKNDWTFEDNADLHRLRGDIVKLVKLKAITLDYSKDIDLTGKCINHFVAIMEACHYML
jgi:hypothetical protein